ncbi:MAG: response regulator, partial [Acidobacteria bacterium]|nr:response regulator [Acidobacteriota bacterium]
LLEGIREEGGSAFEVTWTETVHAASSAMRQKQFDAVLLDLNLPDSHGLETFMTVRAANPNLPIVLLTGTEDEATGLRAVQEGAQDFLVKGQANPPAVVRSIRFGVERNRSLQWHMSKSQHTPGGRVVTFWGVKGGVGTTTLALNMAALMAQEKLVIAAELRSDYGSFAAHFRKPVVSNLSDTYRMAPAEITEPVIEQRLVNTQLGFYLLYGPQEVSQCTEVTPGHADRVVFLMSRIADLVVVDLPSGSAAGHEAVIRRSNCVVLVAERDDTSMMAAKIARNRLQQWGVSIDAIHLVVVNRSPVLENVPKEKIEEAVGLKVAGVVPPAPDICSAAMRASTPLAIHRPRSAPAGILASIALKIAATAAGPAFYVPSEAA